jgi:xanthine dehydrogenase accessory factor
MARCLIRGVGDVGSAVAHTLFSAGHAVVIHDDPAPTAHRRRMAFVDAVFDGSATLEGVTAQRIGDVAKAVREADSRAVIAVHVGPFEALASAAAWDVLVDARMRKRQRSPDLRPLARLTIGLGPGFVVGGNCHAAVETGWEALGAIVREGATAPLHGEPRAILGHARDRLVYAPAAGLFFSDRNIGDIVARGEPVAMIANQTLAAPIAGAIRGLSRSGVPVDIGTKVIEIDPRGPDAVIAGLGERPRRIAEGVTQLVLGP